MHRNKSNDALNTFLLFLMYFPSFLEGHHHAVMMAKLSSDRDYLYTSSRDCTLKAWHLPTRRLVASFDCQSQIKYFGFAEIARDRCFVAAATKMAVTFLDVHLSVDADRRRYGLCGNAS